MCCIKGKIGMTYILPHQAISFQYELLGRFWGRNRSRSFKAWSRSGVGVWKMWLRSSLVGKFHLKFLWVNICLFHYVPFSLQIWIRVAPSSAAVAQPGLHLLGFSTQFWLFLVHLGVSVWFWKILSNLFCFKIKTWQRLIIIIIGLVK